MLDWKIEKSDGWTDIRSDYGQCLSFQRGRGLHVFLDPAGHPFCLGLS